jgi:hypothetical protein
LTRLLLNLYTAHSDVGGTVCVFSFSFSPYVRLVNINVFFLHFFSIQKSAQSV